VLHALDGLAYYSISASMSRTAIPTDTAISDSDEASYQAGVRACQLHLKDLMRVHGPTPTKRPRGRPKAEGQVGLRGSQRRKEKEYQPVLWSSLVRAPLMPLRVALGHRGSALKPARRGAVIRR
jgi:hypothetical protein